MSDSYDKFIEEFISNMELQNILLEDSYEFDLNTFKNLKRLSQKADYVDQALPFIAMGSARAVYELDNEKVIKIAKSQDGIFQNEAEVTGGRCLGELYTPKIYEVGKNFEWIIAEKVQIGDKVLESFRNRFFGANFDLSDFFSILKDLIVYKKPPNMTISPTHAKKMLESPWLRGLMSKIKNCNLEAGDLDKDNWGINTKGQLVMLDLGFFT